MGGPQLSMALLLLLFLLLLPSLFSSSTSLIADTLSSGSSLSVNNLKKDILSSPNGGFIAGFHAVGHNAYSFAVWLSNRTCITECIVWMANRDYPVNGVNSKLILRTNSNLVLTDADHKLVWSTNTNAPSSALLQLQNTGNLVLLSKNVTLWQSFDFPTNTLLPSQKLTRNTALVSSRGLGNNSSGYYKLYFDNDNVLRLLYSGPETTSVYWPAPYKVSWDVGRSTYNNTRVAFLSPLGRFVSSDDFQFRASDYGDITIQRRLSLDFDGNLRLYSLCPKRKWIVTWQAISMPCEIHGICGPSAICRYSPSFGRICSCAPGYKRRDRTDWSRGCEPKFHNLCAKKLDVDVGFVRVPRVDFYGYDADYIVNVSWRECRDKCLSQCNCKGFQYKRDRSCFTKAQLFNGFHYPSGTMYLKLPSSRLSFHENNNNKCKKNNEVFLQRDYSLSHKNNFLVKILLIFAAAIGGLEVTGGLLVWCSMIITRKRHNKVAYHLASLGFRRYTYNELKKATRNFREEIGSGAGGVVYKAVLSGNNHDRVAAVKWLRDIRHGEGEFLAEVSSIGKLNHMNLIEMWGYCAEGKHRLLVYEYMEHGSLAQNLTRGNLDWLKIYNIAIGTARGLAYLHDECLEWILHCDVKPQNILLDAKYQPKVADFGLSKLLNRDNNNLKNSSFSRIRGTRGYMAPEWVYNSTITSKVDVYSYGVVLLEMVTGRRPSGGLMEVNDVGEEDTAMSNRRLTAWLREKVKEDEEVTTATWMEEIVDRRVKGEIDVDKMEVLVKVALQCVEEDMDERPSMSQVVEMLHRGLDNNEDPHHN